MTTMNDVYGDGSDHEYCTECGLCIDCDHCKDYGCDGKIEIEDEKERR